MKLDLPKPSDNVRWKVLNAELSSALPQVFTSSIIHSMSTSDLSKKLDSYLYNFFAEKCGVCKPTECPDNPARSKGLRTRFRHRGLERLRRKKNELRKALRLLIKGGQGESCASAALKKQWLSVMRDHNRLSRAVSARRYAKESTEACKRFRKDPNVFASKLFADSKSEKPLFSKEVASEFFSSTYRDEERSHVYEPLDSLPRPPPPEIVFNEHCPTFKELSKCVRKKPNGSAAGLNALSYVPYKKCPAIMFTLHKIVKKIWKTKEIPDDWAQAFIILLSKSDVLDDPSEFRPIAITIVSGKIVFSVISDRLQKFLVLNDYISRATQKGFLFGLPGCLEHSFTLYEALRNAKTAGRQIIVAFIDLANAYGSVRHNLIQFALNWYHVPALIQELIFNYYEKLMAKVQASDWSTGFFLFDIGLFQGCVLSTILFDAVFQLLLDLLKPHEKHGYSMVQINYKRLTRAYADDLNFSTSNPKTMQEACDTTDRFLSWSQTMKAKPRKCIAAGWKQFDPRFDSGKFTPARQTRYAPFNPNISISGTPMKFMLEKIKSPPDAPGSLERLKQDHFKFLGRWICIDLHEHDVQKFVRSRFFEELDMIGKCKVTGFMKLWLYQHYLLAHLSWPFLIHDLPVSLANDLQKKSNLTLKRWAGIFRGADIGSLFRSRANFGMGLTSISHHFRKMQLIKCSLLENSQDTDVNRVYALKADQSSHWSKKFSASKAHACIAADAQLQAKFPSNPGRMGLGHGLFIGDPSAKDIRRMTTQTESDRYQKELYAHSVSNVMQGQWTKWADYAYPFDLSWKTLIYGFVDKVISFVLNATINCCQTPKMLKLWGYSKSDSCALCKGENCTLHHILANCNVALNQGRFTWRHDSVLLFLESALTEHLANHSKKPKTPQLIKFVGKGDGNKSKSSIDRSSSILDPANDWNLLVDFTTKKIVFPPEIFATPSRPDITMFSPSLKKVILVELTCPAEEGCDAATVRKMGRYEPLLKEINDDPNNPWEASLFTIEAGARGLVAHSMLSFLRKIGLPSRKARSACKSISLIVARCSYAIFLHRDNPNWDSKRELLVAKSDPP